MAVWAMASSVDLAEAYALGAEAARLAIVGETAKMAALREDEQGDMEIVAVPVKRIANQVRLLVADEGGDEQAEVLAGTEQRDAGESEQGRCRAARGPLMLPGQEQSKQHEGDGDAKARQGQGRHMGEHGLAGHRGATREHIRPHEDEHC